MIDFEFEFQYAEAKLPILRQVGGGIPAGRCVVLCGGSGCGKSTLLRCINGLIPQFYEGELKGFCRLNGQDTAGMRIGEIGELAASVFQNPRSQFFTVNSSNEVAFGLENHGLPQDKIRRRVDEAFRIFHLERLKDRNVYELSSGERQLISILSAWAMDTDIFLLDESTANLDFAATQQLKEILLALKKQGIPPSQNKGMGYKEYTEAKRGTSWKQKLKQTIDRLVITAKDYDDFLRLMQEAGYEIKTGKYISFRAKGQERFTRSKTIGENYTEERIKERIAGRTPRRSQRQTTPKGISLIGDIQERIRLIDSKGYEYKAKLTILKEAARTLNYLTENNLLQYADLEKKVEDVHSSYDRTGKELKGVEARLREVQPLIKNISNYQRLKPVYDAFQKAKDKPGFKAKHEAELVIFEAARSTLLAMQGDEKLPSLKTLQAEQAQLFEEQERLYAERNRFKKEAKQIETIKSNVDTFLSPSADHDRDHRRSTQRE